MGKDRQKTADQSAAERDLATGVFIAKNVDEYWGPQYSDPEAGRLSAIYNGRTIPHWWHKVPGTAWEKYLEHGQATVNVLWYLLTPSMEGRILGVDERHLNTRLSFYYQSPSENVSRDNVPPDVRVVEAFGTRVYFPTADLLEAFGVKPRRTARNSPPSPEE
jgi:hypothetical protein